MWLKKIKMEVKWQRWQKNGKKVEERLKKGDRKVTKMTEKR